MAIQCSCHSITSSGNTESKMDWIRNIRKGGDIQRYHTTPMVKAQDVAQHSFNAALMAEWLAVSVNSNRSTLASKSLDVHKVVMHMLLHDIPEQAIGDVPGWVKWSSPDIKKALDEEEFDWCAKNMSQQRAWYMYGLTSEEALLVKFIDLAECCYKIAQDVRMGNSDRKDDVLTCYTRLCKMRDQWYEEFNIGHPHFTQMLDDIYTQYTELP